MRINIAILIFFSSFVTYMLRTNIAICLIAMVKENDDNGTDHVRIQNNISHERFLIIFVSVWTSLQLEQTSSVFDPRCIFFWISRNTAARWTTFREIRWQKCDWNLPFLEFDRHVLNSFCDIRQDLANFHCKIRFGCFRGEFLIIFYIKINHHKR